MKSKNKWLSWALVLMFISFVMSGFFFLKSGVIDLETKTVNENVIYEVNVFNARMNRLLNYPLSEDQKNLLLSEEIESLKNQTQLGKS